MITREREREIKKEIEDIVEKLPEKDQLVRGLFTRESRYRGKNLEEINERFREEDQFRKLRESKEGKRLKRLFDELFKMKELVLSRISEIDKLDIEKSLEVIPEKNYFRIKFKDRGQGYEFNQFLGRLTEEELVGRIAEKISTKTGARLKK